MTIKHINNLYKLPNNNVQITFSGGRTSAYMLYKILENNNGLPKNAVVTFANTGREMPQTLDFVHNCSEKWNVSITWLEYDRPLNKKVTYKIVNRKSASENGEPFELLIRSRGNYLPNVVRRFCTSELKVLTLKRFLVKELKWKKWVQAVGIRADERHRIKTKELDNRWSSWYPLSDNNITKNDISEFWKKQNFDLKLPNINGFCPQGNCDFCFLKSEHTLAFMTREYPEKLKWWIEMEDLSPRNFGRKTDFKTFAKDIELQKDWVFDQEGYFCQKDEGECTG
jgi:3'-phosphoadenosine 5'-phosphosulfate sulfotransferase (PAPS reductase)/FAD synthetase